METERVRLQRLYAELGDEHLRDLGAERDDLTDEARLALSEEMRRRGFEDSTPIDRAAPATAIEERETGFSAGIPGVFPASAAVMEQALEPARESKDGLQSLVSFYDGLELAKACEILDDSEIEPVIEQIDGDPMSGAPPRFEVWVAATEVDNAQRLLRARMGLFPLAEVDSADEAGGVFDEDGMVTLGDFETREEAERVSGLLTAQGIENQCVAPEAEDGETHRVEVRSGDLDRGLELVAAGLGLK